MTRGYGKCSGHSSDAADGDRRHGYGLSGLPICAQEPTSKPGVDHCRKVIIKIGNQQKSDREAKEFSKKFLAIW